MERTTTGIPVRALQELRGWAQERVRLGTDPAWSRYQHMKLIEAINAILRSADANEDGPAVEQLLRIVDPDEADAPHASDWPVQVTS
jgi:hypothetical protein